MKKVGLLLIGALVALLSLAPVAGAHAKRHHVRAVTVCGMVDETSALPATLVLATGGAKRVTIQNTKPVTLPAEVVAGADVCARAKLVRTTPGQPKTKVLAAIKIRPAASVSATGPATITPAGQITVATLSFAFPAGFVLSPKIVDGTKVKAFGTAAAADGAITLKRVTRVRAHHKARGHFKARKATPSATVAGRVSDLTPATATTAGSLKVGGITLAIPAGKVLRPKVANGAFVAATGVVKADVLTLKRVAVLSKAITPVV